MYELKVTIIFCILFIMYHSISKVVANMARKRRNENTLQQGWGLLKLRSLISP